MGGRLSGEHCISFSHFLYAKFSSKQISVIASNCIWFDKRPMLSDILITVASCIKQGAALAKQFSWEMKILYQLALLTFLTGLGTTQDACPSYTKYRATHPGIMRNVRNWCRDVHLGMMTPDNHDAFIESVMWTNKLEKRVWTDYKVFH